MGRMMIPVLSSLLAITGTLRCAELPVRTYTTADGLASNHINCIVSDPRGFLWFCTNGGLSRFDGYQFTNFGADQGLPVPVYELLISREGDHWIGTADGIVHFNPSSSGLRFTVYRAGDSEAHSFQALAEDGEGGVWCGTDHGLCHLKHAAASSRADGAGPWALRSVETCVPEKSPELDAILVDRDGSLWMGGDGLFHRLVDGSCVRYTTKDGLPHDHVSALLQDRDKELWVGTWGGLGRVKSSAMGPLLEKVYLMNLGIGALAKSTSGSLWLGGYGGLRELVRRNGYEGFETSKATQSIRNISALTEDRAGNLWAGSIGANRITHGGFVSYGQQDGLASNIVDSIFEDQKGDLCVVTKAHNVSVVNSFDGARFHAVRPNIPRSITYWGWGWNQITLRDHRGEWWVPTGEGLFRFPQISSVAELGQTQPKAVYTPQNGLAGENVFRLFEDSHGDVWVATVGPGGANGLTRWIRSTGMLRRYTKADNLSTESMISALAEDRDGQIWIGSHSMIGRLREGHFEYFPVVNERPSTWVKAIYVDQRGRVWVASSAGVSRIDSPASPRPSQVTYTTAQGLASNDDSCINEDLWGRIYIGSDHGVDRIDPGPPVRIRHFTPADGLVKGEVRTAFRDHRGALWFGGEGGLSQVKPQSDSPQLPPPILISGLHVRGLAHPLSAMGETELSGLQLRSDQNQIQVEFVGISFVPGDALRYQYRLEGASSGWSPATGERSVNFASLSPGDYRFLVRAVSADGDVSATPATVAFTILAPVWQRWWFRVLVSILVGGLLYSAYRFRVAHLLEFERLRTRIATDLHDDVGSTLSQIAILSEVAARGAGKKLGIDPVASIATLSRELVDSMSDIVWAIDPEQDRLGDLIQRMRRFAGDLFEPADVRVQFHAHEHQRLEMGADTRRQMFLIFKESLHNAVRHSGCTEVQIDLRVEKGNLAFTLQDNGKGFEVSDCRNGHGLASMAHRAKQLGGQFTVTSSPGCGTTICVQVPLSR